MIDSKIQPPPPIYRSGTSDVEIEAAAAKAALKNKRSVTFWQWFILVVSLGGWELATRVKLLDVFFYSMPTAILSRLYEWMTEGIDGVSLWYHLWVTMEESLLGFFTGAIAGIVIGVALGRNKK